MAIQTQKQHHRQHRDVYDCAPMPEITALAPAGPGELPNQVAETLAQIDRALGELAIATDA